MLRASPHLSHFVPLPPWSRKRTRRKKRDVYVTNPIVYREAKLATAMSKYEQVGKGRKGDERSVKVREFRKRKGWQHGRKVSHQYEAIY